MDMDDDVDPGPAPAPEVSASARSAAVSGFTGTFARGTQPATGLTQLSGNGFGDGPTEPMLPGTWPNAEGGQR